MVKERPWEGGLTGEDGEVDFDVGPDHGEGEVVGEFS